MTRAHLKRAVQECDWDLLDRLLEIDASAVNDNYLYTDTWGQWWGLLMQCVAEEQSDGVRVLLKHGANPTLATTGDCEPSLPLTLACERNNRVIQNLLTGSETARYRRQSDPPIPELSEADKAVNAQGETLRSKGVIFPTQTS